MRHGSSYTYSYLNCRCELCVEYQRERNCRYAAKYLEASHANKAARRAQADMQFGRAKK